MRRAVGVAIIRRALEEPIARVRENENACFGYNARTDEYEDLVQSGVIDPTKVMPNPRANDRSFVAARVRSRRNNGAAATQDDMVSGVNAQGLFIPGMTRTAQQNAASIAGPLLTTESVVVERLEKEKTPGHAGRRRHGRHVPRRPVSDRVAGQPRSLARGGGAVLHPCTGVARYRIAPPTRRGMFACTEDLPEQY